MKLLWLWALFSLLPIAVAAVWALRRPTHQVAAVGSLRLWHRALGALDPSATGRTRRVALSWLLLLAGAAAAGLALSRPVYYRQAPARRVAVAIYPSAELAGVAGGHARVVTAFLDRLGPADRVRLILPALLGGPTDFLAPPEAAQRVRALGWLPVPAEHLALPAGGEDAQHLYRFAPATLAAFDGPHVTTVVLPAQPGEVTLDAFAAEPIREGGPIQVFAALRNHTGRRRAGELLVRRERDAATKLPFALAPGGRQALIATLPGGGEFYSATIAGSSGPGAQGFLARRRSVVARVAMTGRDDPLLRRFIRVHPAAEFAPDAKDADAVIAVGVAAPVDKPALVIDPPTPPPACRPGPQLQAIWLRDADLLADHPLLAHVDLTDVAVRRAAGWQPPAAADTRPLLAVRGNALILAGQNPPRVYLAFDLASENTNWAITDSFVIFMANVIGYLAPAVKARTTYSFLPPMRAPYRPDWALVAGPAAAGPSPGPLLHPALYRDPAGSLHAVSLPGLRSAPAPQDPEQRLRDLALPPPQATSDTLALWPPLAVLASLLWLTGWSVRLRA